MDEILSCPSCHQPVDLTNYFCPNCGKKLRSLPPPTTLSAQIVLYLKTLILPPFGFFWGYRYLRQSDSKSKLIGFFVIAITIIEIILLIQSTISMVNNVNQQISQQSELYGP